MWVFALTTLASLLAAPTPEPDAFAAARTLRAGAAARGRSGQLQVWVADVGRPLGLPLATPLPLGARYRWEPALGGRTDLPGRQVYLGTLWAPSRPGVWRLWVETDTAAAALDLLVLTRVPFATKQGSHLNGYRIGRYPTEGSDRTDRYAPPPGFLEITPEMAQLRVSAHLRFGQFLTKDQFGVWPKYLVLDLRLVDKLELVLQELNAMGVRAERLFIMSGYRTPAYNGPGGDGRARLSRHMWGDAADIWVDNDGDGYIDDLNGDGRASLADAYVILQAIDRVEARHPDLVGGAGVYEATAAHGPFVHVDARGYRARW